MVVRERCGGGGGMGQALVTWHRGDVISRGGRVLVVERGGGGGRGWVLVDVVAWWRDMASWWCCGGVVSCAVVT